MLIKPFLVHKLEVQPSFILQQRVHFPFTTWCCFPFQPKFLLIQTSSPAPQQQVQFSFIQQQCVQSPFDCVQLQSSLIRQQQVQLSFIQQKRVQFLFKFLLGFPCQPKFLLIQTVLPDHQLPLLLSLFVDVQLLLLYPVSVSLAAGLSQVRPSPFCPSVPVQV